MGKKKATLDTNILISTFGWEGHPRKVLEKVILGEVEMITSNEQLTELLEVLDYPRFQFSHDQKDRFKELIIELSTIVSIKEKFNVIKTDPDDNRILECAVAGGAEYIVTGDSDLLLLRNFRGINIMTAREFLSETE